MFKLPVIVGFGGFNAAGRSSFHQGYCRTVLDSLSISQQEETIAGLAVMMGLATVRDGQYLRNGEVYGRSALVELVRTEVMDGTLIRRIEKSYFDVDNTHWHKRLDVAPCGEQAIEFLVRARDLPEPLPASWVVEPLADDNKQVKVTIRAHTELKVDSYREFPVQAAGQLPTGFNPAELYRSRFHPRGLQLTVAGASDAINSLGIDWQTVIDAVNPDEVGVYASSIMSQLDADGNGGLLKSRLLGGRVSTKQLALGFNSMPADFINAYLLGSVGVTGSMAGACASFLYNLSLGVEDIKSGRRRVVIVGGSEAPIVPEVMDGYATMGALASDDNLRALDNVPDPDHRRASRPFGENCGFTIGESAQFVVLMDDALAMQLGADIYGAVTDVFVNADGPKKSISSPGPGNYITLAKAVAAAKAMLGESAVRERSFVQAHGSSTPQNRVTESAIFDLVAKAFGIENWPVAAVKTYLGHSLGPASGDQLMSSLGVFKHGFIPGIKTIDKVADDVHQERLHLSVSDIPTGEQGIDVAFLNAKGFGGNNASACVLAPHIVEKMLTKRYGEAAFHSYCERRVNVRALAEDYNQAALRGNFQTIYHFDEGLIDESVIKLSPEVLHMPGFANDIPLPQNNPFQDMF